MATYDKLIYDIPPYQEGNEQDFEFDLDDNFPIDIVSDITMQVRNNFGNVMLEKKKSIGSITLNDRTVSIKFSISDTLGKAGIHSYEIDFKNLENNPFATIGGVFTVNHQINTL